MSIADYNSFGLIPITTNRFVAKITNNAIEIDSHDSGQYIRIHTNIGDKFVIAHAQGSPSLGIYPFILTKENGDVQFYGQGDQVTNYNLEITTDIIGGNSGYIYFNNLKDINDGRDILVYQDTGKNGLLHQAVQNELIMLIQKQLKEMSEQYVN